MALPVLTPMMQVSEIGVESRPFPRLLSLAKAHAEFWRVSLRLSKLDGLLWKDALLDEALDVIHGPLLATSILDLRPIISIEFNCENTSQMN